MISWKHEYLLHFSETLKVCLQRHYEEHILAIQPNNFSISISDNINFKYFFLMTCKKFSYIFVKLTPHQMHFPLYIYIYNSTVTENFTFKYLNFQKEKRKDKYSKQS